MPANVECPCGHTVRVHDELLNTRVKCPVCGELLSTAAARPDDDPAQKFEHTPVESSQGVSGSTDTSAQSTEAESGEANYPDLTSSGKARSVSSLHAKGGFLFAGLPTPCFSCRIQAHPVAGTCPDKVIGTPRNSSPGPPQTVRNHVCRNSPLPRLVPADSRNPAPSGKRFRADPASRISLRQALVSDSAMRKRHRRRPLQRRRHRRLRHRRRHPPGRPDSNRQTPRARSRLI
jgi:hypothetical protein